MCVLSVQRGFYLPSRDVDKHGASSPTAADKIQPQGEDYISNNNSKAVHSLLDPESTRTSPMALWMSQHMGELPDRRTKKKKKHHSREGHVEFQINKSR